MSEMEPIRYSYSSSYANRLALTLAEFKRAGWRGRFLRWGFHLCVAVAVAIEVILLTWFLRTFSVPAIGHKTAHLGVAATLMAIFLAFSVFCYLQRVFVGAISRDAGIRDGSVSGDGVTEQRGAFRSQCEWAAIVGVERTPKATLLLLGDGMGYIIPHDALLNDVTADELNDRITEWRKAAA
jgi:hypothetical protein